MASKVLGLSECAMRRSSALLTIAARDRVFRVALHRRRECQRRRRE